MSNKINRDIYVIRTSKIPEKTAQFKVEKKWSCIVYNKKKLVKLEKWCNKQMLDTCARGIKIAPLQHKCRAKRGTCAEGVQF